jgi:ketosteroid isomerase-like protein
MTYHERATDLYRRAMQGDHLGAFDHYYHNDVVMIEGTGETTRGKAANRERQEHWVDTVAAVHDQDVVAVTADEAKGVTMVESWMDVSFTDGSRRRLEEVAVQHWEGEHIIRERFYYDAS